MAGSIPDISPENQAGRNLMLVKATIFDSNQLVETKNDGRREWDSNPRILADLRFSRPVH
jgi:hypothetical protein